MTEAGATPRRRKWWKYLLGTALGGILVLAGLGWYLTTDAFQNMVRRRLVTELERITGGRVELGSFHTIPLRLRVEARDLTIHGTEGPHEIPYAHVDRVTAQIKIISVLGAEFGFHSLILDHPVIHLMFNPDGSGNQPAPKIKEASGKTPMEQLFRLSISRLEVRRGELLWNDDRVPLDGVFNDISADMNYMILRRRYDGNLLLGKVMTRFDDCRPFAWTMEGHFSLGGNGVEMRSLKATSGRSKVEAAGRLNDFRRPIIEATYHATLDMQELGAVLRRQEVRHGLAEVQGGGKWTAAEFSAAGKFALRDLDWRSPALNVNNAALNSEFSLTPERLTLKQLQGRLLGGAVTGDADISGWMHSKSGNGTRAMDQKGSVTLRVKDISAGATATALATARQPLQKMNLVGTANGTVELRWRGSLRNLETQAALDFSPPVTPRAGQFAPNAQMRATYQAANGNLEVAAFSASTNASRINASGRLAETGNLKVSATTTNVGEWAPILAAFGKPQQIPVLLRGRASFQGTAAGRIPDLGFAGNLEVEDFDYKVPAIARTGEQTVHWDYLNTDIHFSKHGLVAHNGVLRHGPAVIAFDVNASLDQGEFTDETPFSARIDMQGADLAEVLSLAGYNYPARGTTNLSLQASGTRANAQGTGHIQLTNANVYGENIRNIDADLHFSGSDIELQDLHVNYGAAQITGSLGGDLTARTVRFDLAGTNFYLATLPWLSRSPVKIDGRMDFTAKGAGPLQAPNINATLQLHELLFDQERTGDFTVQATSHGRDLELTGTSNFGTAELSLQGKIGMRDDWPATVDVRFNHLDVDALLRTYQHGRLTGHSAVAGEIHLQGPLRNPHQLSLVASLDDAQGDVEKMRLHSDGPVRFSIANDVLRIEPFHMLGQDTDFTARGFVRLTGERQIELRVQGHANLGLLQTFNADFTSSGTTDVDMTVSGTVVQPLVRGKVQVSGGNVAYVDLPSALSDINGSLSFNQNRIQVESLTAHTGGGLVTFGGYATWSNRQLTFDLTLKGDGVRLRYPPGVSSNADADLRFVGNSSTSTLSGNVTVTKLSVTPGFDFGAYIARNARSPALPQTNPLLNGIRLDVHVVTTPELQMQTAVVRLSGDADLRLRGTAARPVIIGRADVLEGQVYFNGTKYELERGEVAFTSPVATTPILDLQATTQVRDYDITLNLTGEPGTERFKVTYRSEPPLPESDIIALLALGHTSQESAQVEQSGQSAFTQEASSAIINQALNSTVSNRMQRLFGVSRIKIDPQGLNTETNLARGPLVTIEQQVANNLTITYSTAVQQAAQQIIHVEYNLTRNVSIVAIRDQNGVVSFDVRIRQRKK